MTKTSESSLAETLQRLRSIVAWFDDAKEADVEEGLARVKEGAELIASARKRLAVLENEFEEVKKKLEE